ncbi:MFS transporter [Streptomyces sp. MUM 2J]|uniref:MFS transporter n=1 Tax=Streptomyces sp. MUM 2J TaxID=2791987 RepID=UPI001F0354D0|nr:MFS transporter [Streptomyces sp. MUM 2J]MCH0564265.1 MFS transporter [Streptomyces sp. MUM 2J]
MAGTHPSPMAGPAQERFGPRLWGLLLVLAGNMLIDALEVSVAVVALPSIGTDLGLAPTGAQWAMTGFAVGFGGLMLFGTRVVNLLGRRRVYLGALLGFAVASLLSAVAQEPWQLVATRLAKGFCAALTAPTGLAIISTAFPEGRPRARAISVYTLFGAGGFTAGLLLSGWLTGHTWRLAFAFPAPVVLVLFAFGLRLVPEQTAPPGTPRRYDLLGAAAFTGALLALVSGITALPGRGVSDPRAVGPLAAAAGLLVLFVLVERSTADPLVDVRPLRSPALRRSALGAACLNGSYLGLLFVLTYQMQTAAGWSPLTSALALVPAAAPPALTALSSGRLVARFGAPRLIAAGAACAFAGYLLQLRPSWPLDYVGRILPTLLLVGAGFVLSFAALNMRATSQLAPAERGAASGLYQTAVQLAAAVAVAAVAALLAAADPGTTPAQAVSACRPALVLVAVLGGAGLLVGLTGLTRSGASATATPSATATGAPRAPRT